MSIRAMLAVVDMHTDLSNQRHELACSDDPASRLKQTQYHDIADNSKDQCSLQIARQFGTQFNILRLDF